MVELDGPIRRGATSILKSLWDYFNVKNYLKHEFIPVFKRDKLAEIEVSNRKKEMRGDELFWDLVTSGRISPKNKKYLRLFGFELSPWFPRKPGMFWDRKAKRARDRAWRYHVKEVVNGGHVFNVAGKELMTELGGIGCLNFSKQRNDILATATNNGFTDGGIPLIMSKSIWKELHGYYKKFGFMKMNIAGELIDIPIELLHPLIRRPDGTNVAVRVESILNVHNRQYRGSIKVTPWTIFETPMNSEPYGFTFITHNLQRDNMDDAVNWMNEYIDDNGGDHIITDFDEETNYLNARFPLSSCLSSSTTEDELLRYCQHVNRRFSRRY